MRDVGRNMWDLGRNLLGTPKGETSGQEVLKSAGLANMWESGFTGFNSTGSAKIWQLDKAHSGTKAKLGRRNSKLKAS